MSTESIPAAWVGCVACYSTGRLVGQWFPAADLDVVTLDDVHEGTDGPWPECEELDIFDSENLPHNANLTLDGVAAWGDTYTQLITDGHAEWWTPYVALADDWHAVDPDDCTITQFTDRYRGCWPSFAEYAHDLADEIELTDGWPDTAERYFNWDAWIRDLKYDYAVIDAPEGGVFIYENK